MATSTSIIPRAIEITSQTLVEPEKDFLLPLHIKLGFMKNVKAMDQSDSGFLN
jgi:hypothetical protein